MWFLSQLFTKGLLQKPPSSSDLTLIGPRPWRHTPRLIVMHVVFRSLLKIFEYAAKQACKQLHCNKAKLSEPASINGLHIHRALGYASRTNNLLYTLDENIGGHIYTVTMSLSQIASQQRVHGFFSSLQLLPKRIQVDETTRNSRVVLIAFLWHRILTGQLKCQAGWSKCCRMKLTSPLPAMRRCKNYRHKIYLNIIMTQIHNSIP